MSTAQEKTQVARLEEHNRELVETAEMQQTRIEQLEEQNRQLWESFDTISNATCWKVTKPVRAVLDFTKRRNEAPFVRLFFHSLRVCGIKATAVKTKRYLSRRTFGAELLKRLEEKQEPIKKSLNQSRGLTAEPLPVDVTVSVIIPTFNGGKDLPDLMALLSKQIDVREIEIIVVDSGSTDDTLTIAADFGAKIIQITQAEFSHSFARNLGAKHASGEYLLFMTQDAKPSSEHWVRDMAQPLLHYIAAAVSCREEPRDDCDLLGRFSIWIHSGYMGILENDRILSMPANQGRDAMRRNGQLNDVACMIRRDVFSSFNYRGDFAEDLDIGLRLIRKGYRISLLASAPVIHSHNRTAYYYMKRTLVDMTRLNQILPGAPSEKISANTAINRIIGTAAVVWHYARELTEAQDIPLERQRFFKWSSQFFDAEKKKLRALRYEDFAPVICQELPFCDEQFHDFVKDMYDHASESFRLNTDWLDTRRINILIMLNDYLVYTGEPFTGETIAQIAELFVKHFAQVAGETLAFYTLAHVGEETFLNDWVRELKRGV